MLLYCAWKFCLKKDDELDRRKNESRPVRVCSLKSWQFSTHWSLLAAFSPYCISKKQTSKKVKKMYMWLNPTKKLKKKSSQIWSIHLSFNLEIQCHTSLETEDWKRGVWKYRHLSYFPFLFIVSMQSTAKNIYRLLSFLSFPLPHVSLDRALTTANSVRNIGRVERRQDEIKMRSKK